MEAAVKENTEPQTGIRDLRMQLQAMTVEDRGELLDSLMHDNLDF